MPTGQVEVMLSGGDIAIVSAKHEVVAGYRILSSTYGFMSPGPGSAYYLESFDLGTPWIRVYALDENGEPDLNDRSARIPVSKREVLRISRR